MKIKDGKIIRSSSEKRSIFMRNVMSDVWTKLNDVGIDYNYGEIKNHFREMMENPDVLEEVVDVFYDRFISV